MGDRFADVEEKYDLAALGEGFGDEGEEAPPDEDGAEASAAKLLRDQYGWNVAKASHDIEVEEF